MVLGVLTRPAFPDIIIVYFKFQETNMVIAKVKIKTMLVVS
jgi:hypothetical protein